MILLLVVSLVFLLLLVSEIWWRRHTRHTEFSRKFVHITVGSFVAFWPFFLSWTEIQLLSLAFLLVVGISKQLHIFKSIHSVQRPTWGELFFAAAVGLVTLITQNKWIYMAALLQMSLADGLAAVIGVRYGKSRRYSVLGHTKSVTGTGTFLVVSLAILIAYEHYSGMPVGILYLIGLPIVAGIVENFGGQGFDNVLVPTLFALVLGSIS